MKHTCVVRCKGCCSGSSGSNSGGGIGSSSRGREGGFGRRQYNYNVNRYENMLY